MMILSDAINDFGIAVSGGVGILLPREGKNYAGVVATHGRKTVGMLTCPNFQARPFAPEVDAARSFNKVRDICTPDASGDFDEIEFVVGVRLQKLGMRHA